MCGKIENPPRPCPVGSLPIVTMSASKSRPPADNEVAAADVVAAVRSGGLGVRVTWEHADTGAEQKMHDFLLVGDGIREALEITTLIEQDSMTDLKHWQKVRPGHDRLVGHRPGASGHRNPSKSLVRRA
jgi:hypothetical protein